MKIRVFLAIAAAAQLFITPVLADSHDKPKDKVETKADTYRLLNLFGDVFERVRSDYVEEATDEALIEAAISGMLSSLDPHSSFLNADRYRDMQVQTRGRFGGLGIEVTMENGLVKVVSPIDDTPAFRAGIEAGDLVYKLDDELVMGLTLAEAVDRMRGKVGTDITLGVRREGREDFDVTITRAIIKIRSVRSRMEGKIGYLRITSFSAQAYAGVKKAMQKFRDEMGDDLAGIVLDLRNNPGGLLGQAVDVSDAFLERGEIVSTRSRLPEDTQRYNATPGDLADGLPIVVLINGGSASASEIVAGALQDHKRALLMGTKSFGKGSVQTIIPLSGQGAMRLTTARYFTPSGRSIQAVGIEPDLLVEQAKLEAITQPKGRREADLRGALVNG
ncbi:MAG: S41 family peptidase, partial [Alphaproteobacteria bacterium]